MMKMVLYQIPQEVIRMTTEAFEKELRKLQDTLELTEEQIQEAIKMHKRIKSGEVSIKKIEIGEL